MILLPTPYFLLPTPYFLLPTPYFLLPTPYFLLPAPYFLLTLSCSTQAMASSMKTSCRCAEPWSFTWLGVGLG